MRYSSAVCLAATVITMAVPGPALPEGTVCLADLALLLENPDRQRAAETLGRALSDTDPRVRGVAARLINVLDLRELQEAIDAATERETDPAAGREAVRARAGLSGDPLPPAPGIYPPTAPRVRGLGDLPAGFAAAVFKAFNCRMPEKAVIGMARVTYDAARRPAAIEPVKMPFSDPCSKAVQVLLRAGLAPDWVSIATQEKHTLYVVLGQDQEERFDEFAPGYDLAYPSPERPGPRRIHFAGPRFPPGKGGVAGRMSVMAIIDCRGVPGNFQIIESGGDDYDLPGLLALSGWRFAPGRTPVWMMVGMTGKVTDPRSGPLTRAIRPV